MVRETTLGAFEHQDLPFEVLVEKLQPERNLAQHPLCQVMFILLRETDKSRERGGIAIEPMEIGRTSSEQDMIMSLYEKESGIEGLLTYSTALFERDTVERMTRHFLTLLESIVAGPARPIDQLEILDEAERRQLLVEWNKTETPCTMVPVHLQFAAQCARTPGAIAIEFEGQTVTYAELLDRSQRLAAHLLQLGAGPGQLIGICVERSPGMIAGVLGILLSGAAYVPFGP